MAGEIHIPRAQGHRPKGRFRGRRRHFDAVRRHARDFRLDLSRTELWWNLWHYHADWKGWGNVRLSYRREYFLALTKVFASIEAALEGRTIPFQLWILLSARDAGEDAVFLHTANPYATEFPLKPNLRPGALGTDLEQLCAHAGLVAIAAAQSSSGDVWLYRPRTSVGFPVSPNDGAGQ